MLNFHKAGLLLFIIAALTSCKDQDNDYSAYFGGIIVNPTSPYILFIKDNKVIDTLPLDKENRFFIKFDSLSPGLYSFKHEPDYQYVYFDKNDSLIVSMNTSNFDRSIVFSGKGDRKNNFMMDLYLDQEKDRKLNSGIYYKSFASFKKNIDSTYSKREDFYRKSKANIKWSDDFDFYANARLKLNYYTKKEQYSYIQKQETGHKTTPQIPPDFYNFRSTINFNDPLLTNFSPFVRYLTAMLNNMSINPEYCDGNYDENSLKDNIIKLDIADSIFTDNKIKNEILNNIAFAYMLRDHNVIDNQRFLDHYLKLSTNNPETNTIKKMSEAVLLLKEGKTLPEIKLLDVNNKLFNIKKDIVKETVVFFWTACAQAHLDLVYKKLNVLKQKHKNLNFIAINIDEDREWKKLVSHYSHENVIQLRAGDFQALKDKWVFTKINRTIILNSDGTIKNAFTNLMDENFTNCLK